MEVEADADSVQLDSSRMEADMSLREKLQSMMKKCIHLEMNEFESYKRAGTRFGGVPDAPPGFVWPRFGGVDGVVRPLSFLAQFNCRELAALDSEGLLPDHGVLSFFYDLDSQCWGFDPSDEGCARVYWFEDEAKLEPVEIPDDLDEDFRFPMIRVNMSEMRSYPSWDDFSAVHPDEEEEYEDEYEDLREELTGEEVEEFSQLLGWPDVIQSSMYEECELTARGYGLGNSEEWDKIPKGVLEEVEAKARDEWMLLLQLDGVSCGDFEIMYGDGGHLYFFIRKEDLQSRRFDRVWLIEQCC